LDIVLPEDTPHVPAGTVYPVAPFALVLLVSEA
jgi:hypothetical protein